MPQKNITTEKYHFFLTDEFSQWYPSHFIDNNGTEFVCCEQWMMYKKAELFNDTKIMEKVLLTVDPDEMKKLGRAVQGFDVAIWEAQASSIVTEGNFLKFSQNPELAQILLSFKNHILVEAAGYDKIWGIGLYAEQAVQVTEKEWLGRNELGKALMRVQEQLTASPELIQSKTINKQKLFSFTDEVGQKTIRLNLHELAQFLNTDISSLKSTLEKESDLITFEYLPFVKKGMSAKKDDLLSVLQTIESSYLLSSNSEKIKLK